MKETCIVILIITLLILSLFAAGCDGMDKQQDAYSSEPIGNSISRDSADGSIAGNAQNAEIVELEDGLSAVRYDGDYGFDEFLARGGAASDTDVVSFLTSTLLSGSGLSFSGSPFGCSTLSVKSREGGWLFGRNFDWENCDALIVSSRPSNGYASISTVNTDFISAGEAGSLIRTSPQILSIAALYAPLDGMNEQGLCVSVNMIQDSATISQDSGKPDITTTTAVRLMLNRAADVGDAIGLLEQYNMHASMDMMVHFALADADGRSVVVEYVGGEMIVTETPVVTNFYHAEGDKNGVGTKQSHERHRLLTDRLSETGTMSMEDVRDALDSVSKDNFGEFESTEWSIVYNQSSREVRYYHRENYESSYAFAVE